ncbi:aspartate/glutamate racemase family protein [Rhodospirillum sp. A1_3_36]|uniref:aspartate/glutamate racemase family protein n=1 Tax=Rhodospirillum sp. A1_3_36 TaxID=3391666 RepID=UPI0039A74C77
MGKRLAFLHTGSFLVDMFKGLLATRYPGLSAFYIVDESLIQDLLTKGESPDIVRRVCTHVTQAESTGADLIVFTCSSTSPAVNVARQMVSIPIIKIDDAMAEQAVGLGKRIGVVCTASSTVGPSTTLLRDHARAQGREIEIEHCLKGDAFQAILSGDRATHDAIVTDAALTLATTCDLVILAQASMMHLRPILAEQTAVPVMTSPEPCVDSLSLYLSPPE